jgi:nitrite reductase/ring-hydroxylating ferredoxin subunit
VKKVATLARAELDQGPVRVVYPPSHIVVLVHDGQVYAMEDACNHSGASLLRGWIEDGCLVCPAHAYAFDLKTGELLRPKGACSAQKVYEVRQVGDALEIWETFEVLVQLGLAPAGKKPQTQE